MAVAERSLGGWGNLPADWAWLMHLSPHDLPGPGRAALAALAVAGAARLAGRGERLGTAAGALGLLAGWGALDLSRGALAPGAPAGRLAVVAAAALGLLLLGDASPRRLRPLLPFGLGAASGWWLAGAPAHGARLLHALAAAALLGAAVDIAARRLGRGGGAARRGRTRREAGVAPAVAGRPQGVVVFAAALSLSAGLLAADSGLGMVGAGGVAAALVALASAAALLPGPEGAAGLVPGLMAAGLAAALGQGHWLRLPVAEDWAVDAAALSPLVVVALGPRLARRWGVVGPCGAAAGMAALAWGLARWTGP